MNSLFEIFDCATTALRSHTGGVRCLRHGDLSFTLRSDEQTGVVLNLSSTHRVIGQVNDASNVEKPSVGTVTIMPPHHTFSFQVVGECRIVALQLSAEDFRGDQWVFDGTMRLRPRVNVDDPILARLIFTTAAAATAAAQRVGLDAITERLIAVDCFAQAGEPSRVVRGGLPPARLRRVVRKLEVNPGGPISLAAMANEAGLSVFHFARAFAASTGWAPHRFVLRQRIHRAVELLGDESLSVGDVAESLGFVHHSHLARTMRRFIGLTPDILRNRVLA
ncbi:helix-turn-helix domain-containing protein [Sphingobium lactosutens]|uniref:helix-turn-helix domain-containing protein n=1 Tax=Sphingobium lactosutens TaxID=522773 RepID=UPI0012678CC1|nr:AraC family transcriptional regulator [Sphingobium lactosutens]